MKPEKSHASTALADSYKEGQHVDPFMQKRQVYYLYWLRLVRLHSIKVEEEVGTEVK